MRLPLSLLACTLLLIGTAAARAHDQYEPDDEPSRATAFPIGTNQIHTFHPFITDEDWVRIFVPPRGVFEIYVEQLTADIDAQVEVYYENFNGAISNVPYLSVDDFGTGIGEEEYTYVDLLLDTELPWGYYLVRVFTGDTNVFGIGAAYKLTIFDPSGVGVLTVSAVDIQDPLGGPPSNAVAVIDGVTDGNRQIVEDCAGRESVQATDLDVVDDERINGGLRSW